MPGNICNYNPISTLSRKELDSRFKDIHRYLCYLSSSTGGTTTTTSSTTTTSTTAFGAGLRPYRVYSALMRQESTNAPVATILENTIGNIVWTREGPGYYAGTLTGAFPLDDCAYFVQYAEIGQRKVLLRNEILSPNAVRIDTYDAVTETPTDDLLGTIDQGATIEIRVYP